MIEEKESCGASFEINYGCPIEKEIANTQKCGTAPGTYNGVIQLGCDLYNGTINKICPTLRTASATDCTHIPAVMCHENHASDSRITESNDVSPLIGSRCGTGGNNLPLVQNVSICSINRQGGDNIEVKQDVTDTITAATNSSGDNMLGVCTKGNGDAFVSDVQYSLLSQGGGQAGQGYSACCDSASVRRLLPVECERLMGFPDNWTRIRWRGKSEEDCPDGPRYKACGNSMCVNVMRWIGIRIQNEVDRINGENK